MKKVLIFTIALLVNFLSNLVGQQLSFNQLSVAQGLSQSTVLSICKDSRGLMWIGTRYCLNRYDGLSFKVYKSDHLDNSSISSNDYIYAIMEDRDKNLWIGTQQGLNRYIPETDSFERIKADSKNQTSLSDNIITSLCQDRNGNLWVGTTMGLNRLENTKSRKFSRFYVEDNKNPGLAGNYVLAIFEDSKARLWVGTSTGLTCLVRQKNGKYGFFHFRHSSQPGSISGDYITTITEDTDGNIWVGTQAEGINLFNESENNFTDFKHNQLSANSLSNNNVRKIFADKNGLLWIATLNGLNTFNFKSKRFTHYKHDKENWGSLSNNSIKEIYKDDKGSLWIGSMFGGINILHSNTIPFKVNKSSNLKNSISSDIICAITADTQKNLWIGTEGEGLNYLNTTNNTFLHFKNDPFNPGSLGSNFVKAILKDRKDNIWVGSYQGGLDLYQKSTQRFKHFRYDPKNSNSLSSDNVTCIYEDSSNRFWVGTLKGLNLFDRKNNSFKHITAESSSGLKISSNFVRVVTEDVSGNLWVGTARGLNLLPPGGTAFKQFVTDEKDSLGLKSNYIHCIYQDKIGRIWIGTYYGGLSLYNPKKNSFTAYTTDDGLISDNVIGILEDETGCLWISTDKGISKFDVKRNSFKNFSIKDGLPANEFNYNSAFKDHKGRMYFGSYNGLVSFYPKDIKENRVTPKVILTGMKLFNKPVKIGGGDKLLEKDISLTKELVFRHDQNIFSLNFAALNYVRPDKNQYSYKLDGFEKEWNLVSVPTATYTNLPAGEYIFLVKGANNDGLWSKNSTRLKIVVLPPFWRTWWALSLYGIAFMIILYIIIRFFRRQARLESDLYHEHLQNEHQQEVYQMKLDFFTKISHEIRTPLTLILAPVEKLIDITKSNAQVNKQLLHVKINTDRLLRLITELLDFRKVETGNMKLQVSENKIVSFCREIHSMFESLAESKNIRYNFNSEISEDESFYFDQNQLEKVLYNIIANAFKFTDDGGIISVSISQNVDHRTQKKVLEVTITDSGIGIAQKNQDEIFDSFYQVGSASQSEGWGLGLALAKNIIEQHKGEISVESKPGCTCFKIILFAGKDHFSPNQFLSSSPYKGHIDSLSNFLQPEYPVVHNDYNSSNGDKKYTILLVEDNEEVRGFLKEYLNKDYVILERANGLEGWEVAITEIPDLIISDVTMPGIDGLQLCHQLKSDERTSHIPVVLLTAKAAYVHQVDGLETGADVYITKPFSIQLLELNIRNLLLSREAMRNKFSSQITLQPQNRIIASPDEKFLNKLMQIVEKQIADPEFGVTTLVKEIGMSQTVLYKKIKALTNLSIADFIKSIRLKQASQLLILNKLSISEVAFAVGFNDRKYFSKEFRKQFGKAPSDYIAEMDSPKSFN